MALLCIALLICKIFCTSLALVALFLTAPKRYYLYLLLLIPFALFAFMRSSSPQAGPGTAHFVPTKAKKSPYKGFLFQGHLKGFSPDGTSQMHTYSLPCTLFSQHEYPLNGEYFIHGELKEGRAKHFHLKSKERWQCIQEKRFSIDVERACAKERLGKYLQKVIVQKEPLALLTGLTTGELNDLVLLKEFERRGLSHLLAISGFHFSLLCSFLLLFLRPFFSYKYKAALLILLVTTYLLFIGNTPSVMRAWISCLLTLIASLIEKESLPLNNLGTALAVALILNPLVAINLGFALSFAATAGILLLYTPLSSLLKPFIPLSLIRSPLALTLAVYITLTPLLLFAFHKIAWHGIFYNLFFPFLIGLALCTLLTATLLHLLLPSLGLLLHTLNTHYTSFLLKLLHYPLIPHHTTYIAHISPWFVASHLTILFFTALYLHQRHTEKWQEFLSFM